MTRSYTFTIGLLLLFIFIINPVILAQDPPPPQQIPKVIQPSPNAASLGKYGDIPVNLHTGIPNISIPLYELKERSITLPISMSYHAGGIRVSEMASWVGLGWALNAGGVITRSIQHVPDEGPMTYNYPPAYYYSNISVNRTGYYTHGYKLKPEYNAYKDTISNLYHDAATGNSDTEPDLFFFNFGGYSGKFIFNVQTDTEQKTVIARQAVFIPKADIKVEVDFRMMSIPLHYDNATEQRESFFSFILTTPDGIRYHFGGIDAIEYTGTESYNMTSYGGSALPQFSPSAWYLTKVEAPDGSSVALEYEVDKYSFFDLAPERVSGGSNMADLTHQLIMRTAISGVRLKRIKGSNIEIIFEANTLREDLSQFKNVGGTEGTPNQNIITSKRLDKIVIKKKNASYPNTNCTSADCLKIFQLNYSYFNCLDNGNFPFDVPKASYYTDLKRLKLDSITEKSGDELVSKPPYVFTYNTTPLPRRISFQQDHWGFYNNAFSNKSLIAFFVAPHNANRSTDANYVKAGVLTAIKYPTGGTSTFTYEANQYTGLGEVIEEYPSTKYTATSYTSFDYPAEETKWIDIQTRIPEPNSACAVGGADCDKFWFSYTIFQGTYPQTAIAYSSDYYTYRNEILAGIYKENGDPVRLLSSMELENANSTYCVGNNQCTYSTGDNFKSITITTSVNLPPGRYQLRAYRYYKAATSTASAVLFRGAISINLPMEADPNYVPKMEMVTRAVGGLRIVKITDTDGMSPEKKIEKTYSYPSGGTLLSRPIYYSNIQKPVDWLPANPLNQIWSSASILPMLTTQGSHIGYAKVRVQQTGNGYSEYSYDLNTYSYTIPNFYTNYFSNGTGGYLSTHRYFPNYPVNPTTHSFERGNLLSEKHYNSANKELSSTSYEYEIGNNSVQVGFKATKMDYVRNGNGMNYVAYTHYPVFTGTSRLLKKTETTYDKDGNNPITMVTDYSYGSTKHLLLTETKRNTSDGYITEKMIYPPDYGTLSTTIGGINLLQQKNIISVPIEKYTIRQNTGGIAQVIGGVINFYRTDVPLIAEVKALELIKPIDQTNFNHSNKTANTFSPDGNYKLKVTYYSYDGLKNIREISKADDVRTVYLWGYGGTLPIAEIKNVADYTTVANALSLIGLSTEASVHSLTDETTIRTKMEELRSKLPSAMISSYTYDSIKGMLSQTGPDGVTSYFTYDNLGRLSLVKDQDSNIVKQYIYRYKK